MKPPLYFPPTLLAAARRAGIDVAAQYPNHEVMVQSEIPKLSEILAPEVLAEVKAVNAVHTKVSKFDRNAYQRELMRKRRAKDKPT